MRASAATFGVVVVLSLAGPGALAGRRRPPGGACRARRRRPPARPERPRLVVFISVDQFRRDYIERYGARWTSGLARLVKDGAVFDQAAYPYFHTITCAGHATMSTGVYPATHGLPLNAWWDRASGREMACTDDGGAKAIGHRAGPKAPTGGHSAHLLRAPTLADVLRQQLTPTPRVVSMSMKPRAAIMLAGHAGDAVLWYTPEGGPTTSTAYAGSPIPFASKFAQNNPTPAELTGEWKKLLPDDAYQNEDDGLGEHPPDGWTSTFPHPLTQTRTDGRVMSYWQSTPAADAFLARLAMAAVDELKLGREHLDYLAISFSELDTTGHGVRARQPRGAGRPAAPRSLHRRAARPPRRQGRQGPLRGRAHRRPRRRAAARAPQEPRRGRRPRQPEAAGHRARRRARARAGARPPTSAGSSTPTSTSRPASTRGSRRTPRRWPRSSASSSGRRASPRSFRTDQIEAAPAPGDDPALVALRLSRVPDRSGDLFLVPRPFWITNLTGTTHGSPQPYDREVPVLLFGAGIKGGHYGEPASPADIVPTLAALAGVQMPKTDGRVLREALSAPPHVTTP